ncbi:MAG: hypothetical protein WC820_05850 [Spirochaetales bacterium]|jgi:hypothetical protein
MQKKNGILPILALSAAFFSPLSLFALVSPRPAETIRLGSTCTDRVFAQLILSDSQAYKAATENLLSYFKNELMKTRLFKDTYGDIVWDDISEEVADSVDIVRDRKMEKERYGDKQFAFTGVVFDLYAEVAIDKATGVVMKTIIELE